MLASLRSARSDRHVSSRIVLVGSGCGARLVVAQELLVGRSFLGDRFGSNREIVLRRVCGGRLFRTRLKPVHVTLLFGFRLDQLPRYVSIRRMKLRRSEHGWLCWFSRSLLEQFLTGVGEDCLRLIFSMLRRTCGLQYLDTAVTHSVIFYILELASQLCLDLGTGGAWAAQEAIANCRHGGVSAHRTTASLTRVGLNLLHNFPILLLNLLFDTRIFVR